MVIQPILTNVLIKPLKEKIKTAGGIYLPQATKKLPDIGKVMAVGPDAHPRIKVGRKVLFRKWETMDVPMSELNETWLMIDHKQILALV